MTIGLLSAKKYGNGGKNNIQYINLHEDVPVPSLMSLAAKKSTPPCNRLHFEEPLLQVLSNLHLRFNRGLAGLLDKKMGRFEHGAYPT